MHPSVVIRDATPADCAGLTKLVRTSAAYDGDYRIMVENITIDEHYLSSSTVRIADDGAIAGMHSLIAPGCGATGECELDRLFVADDRQGCGIGRFLIADACRSAAAARLSSMHIEAHPPAEGFYLRQGARRTGTVAATERAPWLRPMLALDLPAPK
jgi:GNAT superfamily N-acetyltransferase